MKSQYQKPDDNGRFQSLSGTQTLSRTFFDGFYDNSPQTDQGN